jgi:hypothetical protein
MHHDSEVLKADGVELNHARKKQLSAFVQFFRHGGIAIENRRVALMC